MTCSEPGCDCPVQICYHGDGLFYCWPHFMERLKDEMTKQIKCDMCKKPAVYKEGTFNYCAKHAPIWASDTKQPKPQPYIPGLGAFKPDDELTGVAFREKRKR